MKIKKIAAVLAAVSLSCIALTACGGSNASSSSAAASSEASAIVGKWEVTAFMDTNSGDSYDIDEYAELNGVAADDIRVDYVFAEDGTCQCILQGNTADGKYTFDGLNVSCSFDNGTEVAFEYDSEGPVLVAYDEASGISSMLYQVG